MSEVRCLVHAIDQDIIKKDQGISLQCQMEDRLHQRLKRKWIQKPKGHYEELVISLVHPKCSLFNVRRVYSYLVVAGAEVYFGEDLSPGEFIQ